MDPGLSGEPATAAHGGAARQEADGDAGKALAATGRAQPGDSAIRAGVRLGVDVGAVRVGVARSDPDGLIGSPLTTVRRGRGDADEIARLAAECAAVEIIVGLPTTLAGREGRAAAGAREFAAGLAARVAPLPVRLFDERFTTVTAHDALREGGRKSRSRREVVDKAAAAVLLQAALDGERGTGRPPGELVPVRARPCEVAP